jgi:hypothetical protein
VSFQLEGVKLKTNTERADVHEKKEEDEECVLMKAPVITKIHVSVGSDEEDWYLQK